MVRFIFYEDILIYKTKIIKVINRLMNHTNFEIIEIIDNDFKPQNNDILIYIVDLEKKNSTKFIERIQQNPANKTYIICLTQRWEKVHILFQHHFLIYDVIQKYKDYESKIQKSIEQIISYNQKNKKLINFHKEQIQIPENEIKELIILRDKIILKGRNIKKENYTYIVDGNFSDIKEQVVKNFSCKNDNNIIFFKDNNFNLNINLEITTKKTYVKPYQKEKQKEILSLYKKGFKVKKLSKTYSISTTTIYNWIKNDKILTLINKAQKYDKIVQITKE